MIQSLLTALDSDAALNAAWARRAGMISCLPRSARELGCWREKQRALATRKQRPGSASRGECVLAGFFVAGEDRRAPWAGVRLFTYFV